VAHFWSSLVQKPAAIGNLIVGCADAGTLPAIATNATIHPRIDTPTLAQDDVMVADLARAINPPVRNVVPWSR